MNWTRALKDRGGWQEVSAAFQTLPQSTEQVMHPEKYFAHETPVKVTLPDITSLLNSGSRVATKSVPPAVAGGSANARSVPSASADGSGSQRSQASVNQ